MASQKALVLAGSVPVLQELAATDSLVSATPSFGDVTNTVLTTAGQQALKVATVAALLALPFAVLGDGYAVDLQGYASAGDGGGSAMRWSAASTATPDGGLVFAPTGNTGAGRWLRCLDGKRPSSRMFGTLGQGADETYQFQAFLNAGGGAISPPLTAGQAYIVGAPASNAPSVAIGSLWVPSGCQVVGDRTTVIQQVRPAGAASSIFPTMVTDRALNGAQDIALVGFRLNLDGSAATQPAICGGNPIWGSALLFRASYSTIDRLTVDNGWDNCITVGDHGTDAENAYNAIAFAGDVTNGSATIQNVTNVAQLAIGRRVTGTGIPGSAANAATTTYIEAISGTSITLTNPFSGTTATQQALVAPGIDLSFNQQVEARGVRTNNGGCGVHSSYQLNAAVGLSGNGIDVTNCFCFHGEGCWDVGSSNGFGFDTGGNCTGAFVDCTSISARLDNQHPTNGSGIGFGSGQPGTKFVACRSFYAGLHGFWGPSNKPSGSYQTPTIDFSACYSFFSGGHAFLFNHAAQATGCIGQDPGQLCSFRAIATSGSSTLTAVTNSGFLALATGVGNPLALVTGPGIPTGTYITGVDPVLAHVVLSNSVTSGDGVTALGGFAVPPQFDAFRVQGTFANIPNYTLAGCRAVDDVGNMDKELREVATTPSASMSGYGDGGVYTVTGTVLGGLNVDPTALLGTTLVVTPATAPSFANVPASHNWLINPPFAVNQRGYASGAALASGAYAHDRWKAFAGPASYTFTQAAGGDTTVTISGAIAQIIDAPNVTDTSAWVTWVGTSPLYVAQNGTVLENFVAGTTYVVNGQTIRGVLVTGLTVGAPLTIAFGQGTLTRPQVAHVSSTVLPPGFARRQFGEEVYLCQRYYYVFQATGQDLFYCIASGSATLVYNMKFPSNMRTTPTCSVTAGTSGTFASNMPSVSGISSDHASLRGDTTAAGNYAYVTSFIANAEL